MVTSMKNIFCVDSHNAGLRGPGLVSFFNSI